jgi:hypothetical protein
MDNHVVKKFIKDSGVDYKDMPVYTIGKHAPYRNADILSRYGKESGSGLTNAWGRGKKKIHVNVAICVIYI